MVYQLIRRDGRGVITGRNQRELMDAKNDINRRPSVADLPEPLQQLITHGWSPEPEDRPPFDVWAEVLKEMNYKIWPDVDSEEVQRFVDSVESWESFVPSEAKNE